MRVIVLVPSHTNKAVAFDVFTRSSKWFEFEAFKPWGDKEEGYNRSTGFILNLLTFGFAMEWWDDWEG